MVVLAASEVNARPTEGSAPMGAARTAVDSLIALLVSAVGPLLKIEEGISRGDGPAVTVRVVSLDRVGRSRRDGLILDLRLTAAVFATGPHSVDATEQMLRAIEVDPRFTAGPLPWTPEPAAGLGFLVSVPVSVRLEETAGPQVRQPLQVAIRVARAVSGVVVDNEGNPVRGALVRTADNQTSTHSDADGHFALLNPTEQVSQLHIDVRGTTRTFDAPAGHLPLVIKWE